MFLHFKRKLFLAFLKNNKGALGAPLKSVITRCYYCSAGE
ncbi:MAG: hypothetical protein ACJAU2_000667 [Maribacter sp.]|jgi:hypothetical protein